MNALGVVDGEFDREGFYPMIVVSDFSHSRVSVSPVINEAFCLTIGFLYPVIENIFQNSFRDSNMRSAEELAQRCRPRW